MSGSLIIVLIIVVWLFVLAPLLLRGQKPIRKAGEAFEETRVLYEGGSGALPAPRHPRSSPTSAHTPADRDESEAAADYDIVNPNGDDLDDLDGVLIDDNDSPRASRPSFIGMFTRSEKPTEESAEGIVDGEVVQEIEAADTAVVTSEAEYADVEDDDFFDEEETTYAYDDSYTSPADLLYPEPPVALDMMDTQDLTESANDDETEASTADTADTVDTADTDLTDEEIQFAERRRGRGGYDPVADAEYTLTRYQRRQRTLIGLGAAVVVTAVIGFIVGGWMWSLPIVAVLATAFYLFALRNQVRQEEALRKRRIRQLRRATLGVRSAADAELDIPRNLRRPGAVVLEVDDQSPDFDYLPVVESRFEQEAEQVRHEGRRQHRHSRHTFSDGRRAS